MNIAFKHHFHCQVVGNSFVSTDFKDECIFFFSFFFLSYKSLCLRKPTIWFPTRSDTNRAVQSQKMVRGWKFWFQKVEELYYSCSESASQ